MTSLPIVNDDKANDTCSWNGIVLVPTTRFIAEGSRLIRIPDIVIAGAPGVIVWPLMTYCPALLVAIVSFSMGKPGFGVDSCFATGKLVPSTITLLTEDKRAIGTLDVCIVGPPAKAVWDAMTRFEAASMSYRCTSEPAVSTEFALPGDVWGASSSNVSGSLLGVFTS